MKLAALVLLVAVGIALNVLGSVALTPDQIIKTLMGGAPPYWNVCFALDSSDTVNNTEWKMSKWATRDILAIINNTPSQNSIALEKHRIGLVRFSSRAQHIFFLGTYPFYPQNDAAIAAVPKLGGMTNIFDALGRCKGQLGFSGERLVWMISDGQHNTWGYPVTRANAMKKYGIKICIVAIGNSVNMRKVNAMASWIVVKYKEYVDSTSFSVTYRSTMCVLRYKTFEEYMIATFSARWRVIPWGRTSLSLRLASL